MTIAAPALALNDTQNCTHINLTHMPGKFILLLTLLLTNILTTATAQDTLLPVSYHGQLDSLQSTTLTQKRYFQVFTPPGYVPGSNEKYDVLYVLDGGNWNIGLILPMQRFIQANGQMPPTLVVSVMGIDRNVELTPTHVSTYNAPTGGADKFLGYIKDELIPYIDQHYPSNGDNTIWGHSLGGLFVVYAMLKAPDAFKSYIAVDPSLWWDNHYVPKLAGAALPALANKKLTLFIGGRQGPPLQDMGIDTMETILRKQAPPGLTWTMVPYADETHSSVRFKTTFDGLHFTYAGTMDYFELIPMGGIMAKDKPITIRYDNDTARVYYTLDGSVPTESSAKAEHKITLTAPATVIYKKFTNRSRYDKTFTASFKAGETLKPASMPKQVVAGGFNYSYYEADSIQLRDLKKLTPVKTGIADSTFDVTKLPRNKDYALLITGWIQAREDGYYTFYFRNQKGAKLYLGDQLLVQYDETNPSPVLTYIVPLAKGFYPFREEYVNKWTFRIEQPYTAYYITPGSARPNNPSPIPVAVEYHR
jgi:predicted alpha/beta superfamily hydrolase